LNVDDIGVMTTRLHLAVQRELFTRLASRGFADLAPRHGAVLAYVGDGARASDLVVRGGRNKQTVTRLIDELEQLGYVERRPGSPDRRTKVVALTRRGRAEVRAAREILADIERHYSSAIGAGSWATWRSQLARLLEANQD
jgi:DNA-binding MarR family transcriptional regulator